MCVFARFFVLLLIAPQYLVRNMLKLISTEVQITEFRILLLDILSKSVLTPITFRTLTIKSTTTTM